MNKATQKCMHTYITYILTLLIPLSSCSAEP